MSPYCVTIYWVTVIISMVIPALPTHLWGENSGDRWFWQKHQCCGAFLFVLLSAWIICWTNSRFAHGWRCYEANVMSLYWLIVIFKMLSGPNGTTWLLFALQRKLHWLSWILIVPFKDGKLFMIILSSAIPADNQCTESTRPSKI